MLKYLALFLFIASAIGCRNVSEVVRIGPNLYTINATSPYVSPKAKTTMLQEAARFAEERGKVAEKVSLKEEHPAVGTGGYYEYQFRLVDED